MERLKIGMQGERVIVEVHVVPRAAKSAVLGVHDGRFKLSLCAPPVDGEANRALIAFFAQALGVPRRHVALIRGEKSRQKTLAITGVRRPGKIILSDRRRGARPAVFQIREDTRRILRI